MLFDDAMIQHFLGFAWGIQFANYASEFVNRIEIHNLLL